MAQKFSELRSKLSPAALQRADAKAKVMLAEMPLHELRQAHDLLKNIEGDVIQVQKSLIAMSLPRQSLPSGKAVGLNPRSAPEAQLSQALRATICSKQRRGRRTTRLRF